MNLLEDKMYFIRNEFLYSQQEQMRISYNRQRNKEAHEVIHITVWHGCERRVS